jgi:hypothetical protein
MWTFFEQVESFSTDLLLLETTASTQNIRGYVVNCGLDLSASCLGDSFHIVVWDSACAKDSSVGKPLSCQVSDWEL